MDEGLRVCPLRRCSGFAMCGSSPCQPWEHRSCSKRGHLYHEVVPSSCFPLLAGHEFWDTSIGFFFFHGKFFNVSIFVMTATSLGQKACHGADDVFSHLGACPEDENELAWLAWEICESSHLHTIPCSCQADHWLLSLEGMLSCRTHNGVRLDHIRTWSSPSPSLSCLGDCSFIVLDEGLPPISADTATKPWCSLVHLSSDHPCLPNYLPVSLPFLRAL